MSSPLVDEQLAVPVRLLTLVPLVLLMITGLCLFVLPYVDRIDGRPRSDA